MKEEKKKENKLLKNFLSLIFHKEMNKLKKLPIHLHLWEKFQKLKKIADIKKKFFIFDFPTQLKNFEVSLKLQRNFKSF